MSSDRAITDHDDEDIPPVQFTLRNVEGEDGTISLRQHALGLDMYALIRPGDDGPEVEASHMSFVELLQVLAFVVVTGLQAEDITADDRASVLAVFEATR